MEGWELAAGFSLAPTSAFPQSADASARTAAQSSPGEDSHPDLLDGSLSGKGDLEADQAELAGLPPSTPLQPWLAFKKQLLDQYGFAIAGSYGVLRIGIDEIGRKELADRILEAIVE